MPTGKTFKREKKKSGGFTIEKKQKGGFIAGVGWGKNLLLQEGFFTSKLYLG